MEEEIYKMEGNEGRGTRLYVLYHSLTSHTTFHPLCSIQKEIIYCTVLKGKMMLLSGIQLLLLLL